MEIFWSLIAIRQHENTVICWSIPLEQSFCKLRNYSFELCSGYLFLSRHTCVDPLDCHFLNNFWEAFKMCFTKSPDTYIHSYTHDHVHVNRYRHTHIYYLIDFLFFLEWCWRKRDKWYWRFSASSSSIYWTTGEAKSEAKVLDLESDESGYKSQI